MRTFVNDTLNTTWSRAVPAPEGIGNPHLTRLLGFLNHIQQMDATQRSHFGPSKATVTTLFLRLFGQQISGTKPTIYQAMLEKVKSALDNWPEATDSPAPAPAHVPAPACPFCHGSSSNCTGNCIYSVLEPVCGPSPSSTVSFQICFSRRGLFKPLCICEDTLQ